MKRLLFLFPHYKFVNESVFPYMNRCIKIRSKDILIYLFEENNETKNPHFHKSEGDTIKSLTRQFFGLRLQ